MKKMIVISIIAFLLFTGETAIGQPCWPTPCGCELTGWYTTNSPNCGVTTDVTVTVAGGTAPYTFGWSDSFGNGGVITIPTSSYTIYGLPSGVYSLWVTSSDGCSWFGTCTNPGPLFAWSTSWFNCNNNGICTTVTGGTPPYTYNWSNGTHNQCVTNVPAGVYSVTITDANGCQQILQDSVSAVLNDYITDNAATICAGESYLFAGQLLTMSGNYSYPYTAMNGCDSVVTLNLTVLPIIQSNLVETICAGEFFTVGSQSFNTTGNYTVILDAANNCDSIVHLSLTVLNDYITDNAATICAGESYLFAGQLLTMSGNYSYPYTAMNGCDSVVTLNLTVLPIIQSNLVETICAGEFFTVGSQSFNTTGNYTVILDAANNCDSIVHLSLTVLNDYITDNAATICAGESYLFAGQLLTMSGNYSYPYTAMNGCDSVVTLNLTVLPIIQSNLVETICAGEFFTVGSQSFNTTGNYTVILDAANNCDSIVHLSLTVLNDYITDNAATICAGESYLFAGQLLTMSGNYSYPYTAMNGCDSVVTLNLTVLPIIQSNLVETICAGEFFTVGSQSFNTTGNYTVILDAANNCDSIVHLSLSVNYPTFGIVYNQACTVVPVDTIPAGLNWLGCDSFTIVITTLLPEMVIVLDSTICANQLPLFYNGNLLSQEGTYSWELISSNGCDSTVNLSLFVNYPTFGIVYQEACVLVPTDTVSAGSNWLGCDSFNLIITTLLPEMVTILDSTICPNLLPLFFNGNWITQEGVYSWTLPSSNGCDSLVVLGLFINEPAQSSIFASICNGETYSFGGQLLNVAGTYADTIATVSCDSIVTLELIVLSSEVHLIISEDETISCSDTIPDTQVSGWFLSGTGDTVSVTASITENYATDGCIQWLTRVASITGPCGNTVTFEQVITIVDDTAPVFLTIPEDITIDSLEDLLMIDSVVVTEDCHSVNLVSSFTQVNDSTYIRTWTATDACGNASVAQQMVVVQQVPPVVNPVDSLCKVILTPNPANVGVQVTAQIHGVVGNVFITISDMSGKTVWTTEVGPLGLSITTVNFPNLPTGLYVVCFNIPELAVADREFCRQLVIL